jgi:hypothetical protein
MESAATPEGMTALISSVGTYFAAPAKVFVSGAIYHKQESYVESNPETGIATGGRITGIAI